MKRNAVLTALVALMVSSMLVTGCSVGKSSDDKSNEETTEETRDQGSETTEDEDNESNDDSDDESDDSEEPESDSDESSGDEDSDSSDSGDFDSSDFDEDLPDFSDDGAALPDDLDELLAEQDRLIGELNETLADLGSSSSGSGSGEASVNSSDTSRLEDSIEERLESEYGGDFDASCPSSMNVRSGERFECSAEGPDDSLRIDVEIKSDDGFVEWRLGSYYAPWLEEKVEDLILREVGRSVTVSCPSSERVGVGNTFDCAISPPDGYDYKIEVVGTDDSGGLRYRVVPT